MVIINRCVKFHSDEDEARLVARRTSATRPELANAWHEFLKANPSEPEVQDFLERHPALLPGLMDLHNGPLHDVLITKLPLGSDYKTDFAFVTRHSMALQFTFVEIEAPSKTVFNKDGSFTQEFNHSRQQVADWVAWGQKHMSVLLEMFSPMFETYNAAEDQKNVRAYLVYGRREEVEADRFRKERWQSIQLSTDKSVIVMTYDRLRALPMDDLMVCTYEQRGLYAKSSAI